MINPTLKQNNNIIMAKKANETNKKGAYEEFVEYYKNNSSKEQAMEWKRQNFEAIERLRKQLGLPREALSLYM